MQLGNRQARNIKVEHDAAPRHDSSPSVWNKTCSEMGGDNLQTAPPEIAAEIQSRLDQICDLGYAATQVSYQDFLFRPVS